MNQTPAEDLAAYLWPDANPEQIRILAASLLRAFQKLKPAPGVALQTIYKKTRK